MMNRYFPISTISDSEADRILAFSVFAWLVSCAVPPIGLLLQFPVIAYLTWKADIKGIPALLLLSLGRQNLAFFAMEGHMVLRLGFALNPMIIFILGTFLIAVTSIVKGKYDGSARLFAVFWLASIIPASIMSFQAKANGLAGYWSSPILDFFIPSVYFWGLTVSRTYEAGKTYFVKRLVLVLIAIEALQFVRIMKLFTFSVSGLIISFYFYFARANRRFGSGWRFLSGIGIVASLLLMVFGRKMDMLAAGASSVASADEYGSTFSRMGVYAAAIVFIFWFRYRSFMNRFLPILIVAVNLSFVNYVISTQDSANHKDVTFQYETLEERFTAKIFGDRAGVWTMGWDEMKTPPYFIKDLRSFLSFNEKNGWGMKLLPHNQFLTLLGRHGWWLGLTLAVFIIWIWVRAIKAVYYCMDDPLLYMVFIPTGLAIFAVVGTTGQAVVGSALWSNSLTCIIMPAIIYGVWLERRKIGMVR